MGSVEHRWKRQSPSASSTGGIKQELDREVEYVAQKMGVQTWHVVFFVVLLCLALIGLCAWCVIRFFRKKRTGKDKDADLAADEAALVDNEEEDLKVDEEALAAAKAASEYLGKLQYEIKYDFNTQTLVVKVRLSQPRSFVKSSVMILKKIFTGHPGRRASSHGHGRFVRSLCQNLLDP